MTSIASSPIFRQTAASPFASNPPTYDPTGAELYRASTICSMRVSIVGAAAPSPCSAVKKHVGLFV